MQVHRQVDCAYVDMLQCLKLCDAEVDLDNLDQVVQVLRKCGTPLPGEDVTHIFAHNEPAHAHNAAQLGKLRGRAWVFKAVDRDVGGDADDLLNGPLQQSVELKVGAQVICVLNDKQLRVVNGERGEVTGLCADNVTVRFESGGQKVLPRVEWRTQRGSTRSQVPLRLAWAMTVHRVQGLVRFVRVHPALLPPHAQLFRRRACLR